MPRRSDNPEAQRLQERALDLFDKAAALRDAEAYLSDLAHRVLLDAWRSGASPGDVADALGVSRTTIYNWLDEAEKADAPSWSASFPDAERVSVDGQRVTKLKEATSE